MNELLTFSFIGGDLRQLCVISSLAAEGYHIRIFGFSNEHYDFPDNVYIAADVPSCLSGSDVVVLPLPYSSDCSVDIENRRINTPLANTRVRLADVIGSVPNGAVLFAGKIDEGLGELCGKRGIKFVDYGAREELSVMNAIPTAEGAIELAMSNTVHTINNSRCLVVGYGKIGKILSNDLKSLGARVTSAARRYSDLAWISANGCTPCRTSDIYKIVGEFDIIFNTVPAKVLDFKAISRTKSDVLIIDLASKPGGVDFDVARELGRRVIWGLSLPGDVIG